MTCTKIQPLLEAFADHDLSALTQWRVRRHLPHCPACTVELAELDALTARVHAWHNVPAPAGLEARIAATLPAAAPVPTQLPVRRAAVGLAGFAAALAAAFWLVPGQPGRPTVAFADVERAMQQVQTVSWRTTVKARTIVNGEEKPGDKSKPYTITNTTWLRRNPAAIAMTNYSLTYAVPITPNDNLTVKILQDERGEFHLRENECIVMPTHTPISQRVTKQIESLTQPPQATGASVSLPGQAKAVVTSFHQENVRVAGQNQTRFDRDVKTTWPEGFGKNKYRLVHVIDWVSSDTHRLVRVETRLTEDTTGVKPFTTLVEDHFQYNTPAPPNVFDWSPPPGMKIRHKL